MSESALSVSGHRYGKSGHKTQPWHSGRLFSFNFTGCRQTFHNPAPNSRIRLDANPIIDGGSNSLLAAQVAFGGLHRNVPQEKLDLLQLPSRSMAEPSTGPPQIVRRQFGHSNASGGFLHDVPNRLYRHPISPSPAYFVDAGGTIFRDQWRPLRASRRVRLSPNREPEPSEYGLPCQSNRQWPNALRAAGDDPMSKPRLHVSSTHTRVAMPAKLGHVSL